MLHTFGRGDGGLLALLGFTPPDLAHLTSNQPISVPGESIGLSGPFVILFETDPMVEFYAAQPWAKVLLIRQSTIDALHRAEIVKIELSIAGEKSAILVLFFGKDDDALVQFLKTSGLASPDVKVTSDVPPSKPSKPAEVVAAPPAVVEASPLARFTPGVLFDLAPAAGIGGLSVFLLVYSLVSHVHDASMVRIIALVLLGSAGWLGWTHWPPPTAGTKP
jgi:hypothetical protein